MGERLENQALTVVELLIRAQYQKKRVEILDVEGGPKWPPGAAILDRPQHGGMLLSKNAGGVTTYTTSGVEYPLQIEIS